MFSCDAFIIRVAIVSVIYPKLVPIINNGAECVFNFSNKLFEFGVIRNNTLTTTCKSICFIIKAIKVKLPICITFNNSRCLYMLEDIFLTNPTVYKEVK